MMSPALGSNLYSTAVALLRRRRAGDFHALDVADGQELEGHRLLDQGVDEPRRDDLDLVDLALQEEIAGERCDGARFLESGRIAVRKLGDELAARAGDELRGLAARRDEDRGRAGSPAPRGGTGCC